MEVHQASELAAAPPDLPPLSRRDEVLVARFPLPASVPDALVNKKLLAKALDVSPTTIDAWELDGLPIHQKGTNGRAYLIRLSVAYAWRMDRDATEEAFRRQGEDAVEQLRLELLGGTSADLARAALSPRERKEALDVERAYILAAAARREFIRAEEVATAFEAIFSAIRDGLDATPDRIGRELDLDGEAIERVQTILDSVLITAREEITRLLEGE